MRRKPCTSITVSIAVILLTLLAGLPAFGVEIRPEESIMPVLRAEVSRQDPAIIGEEFTIFYIVRNISDNPAYHVTYSFHVMGVGENQYNPFTLKEEAVSIERLAPGASATVPVKLEVKTDARESTQYEVNGVFSYVGADRYGSGEEVPGYVSPIPPIANAISWVPISYASSKPNLTVTELTVLEDNPDLLEGFTIRMSLKNSSLIYDLRSVLVQLDGGDNFEITEITNKKEIAKISTSQTTQVTFQLRAKENRLTNTVTLNTSFDYSHGTARETATKEELFIPVREESTAGGRIPRVIIKRYSLSKEQVLAGDRIDLTLEIENTHERPVRNALINFGVESTTSEGGGSASSTVFAPVGSSNTFHVAEIRGRSTITNTITFAVDASALARTYIVPVTITYEDDRGLLEPLRIADNVNIQVTQKAKLSVTSMNLPAHATVGMPTPVMAEFVNSGKVELADFSIRLAGAFDTMDATLYRATLGIGSTSSYTGMIIAAQEGEAEGKLLVSYIDGNNQEIVEEYPFTLSVAPPEDIGGFGPDDGRFPPDGKIPPVQEGNLILRIIQSNWSYMLLIALVLGQFIYILRLKKKAKEDFFDE